MTFDSETTMTTEVAMESKANDLNDAELCAAILVVSQYEFRVKDRLAEVKRRRESLVRHQMQRQANDTGKLFQ